MAWLKYTQGVVDTVLIASSGTTLCFFLFFFQHTKQKTWHRYPEHFELALRKMDGLFLPR